MKIKYIFSLVALLAFGRLSAQDAADNFFLSFSSSIFLDIVKTPIGSVEAFIGNNPDGTKAYTDAPTQSVQFSSYSFGFEPRFNVHKINDDAAIGVSMPISFGIGYAVPANDFVKGIQGALGSIQVPLLAKFYYGNSSTYNTEKDFGISIGGGLEYNKIGLVGGEEDDKADGLHKGFILPVMSMGVHFWRGNTPFEVNVKYGTTKTVEYRFDSDGNPLKNEAGDLISRTGKGSSFKLTFLYLLNY